MKKYKIDCPLCSVFMVQHECLTFECPVCKGVFLAYRGKRKKAINATAAMLERRAV